MEFVSTYYDFYDCLLSSFPANFVFQIFSLALHRNLVWHHLIIINYAAFSGRLILSRKTDTIKHLTFPIASGVHGICLIVTTLCQSVSMFWLVSVPHHTSREMLQLLVSKEGQGLDSTSKLPSTKLLITETFQCVFSATYQKTWIKLTEHMSGSPKWYHFDLMTAAVLSHKYKMALII